MIAEIPYFTIEPIYIGPLPLQPFGLLLAFGVIFGAWLGRRRAEYLGLDIEELRRSLIWVVGLGFVGAHVFDTLAYRPGDLVDDPLLLFKLWAGISSYGGFLGGAFGFWLFFYHVNPRLPTRVYADTYIWGLAVGFTFGRLGCTIVHDHIGARADDFFLATMYTAEAARRHGVEPGLHHNLGMYEFFYMVFICLVLLALDRGGRGKLPPGSLVLITGLLYAPIRFFLDYLRLDPSDPRYAGLTFAQWVSIATVLACAYGLIVLLRSRGYEPPGVGGVAAAGKAADEPAGQPASKGQGNAGDKAAGKAAGKPGGGARKRRGKK